MNIKILLADDEPRWRAIVRDFLESEGYSVTEAGTGAEAVALLRESRDYALIILDIMMPDMNGLEACRAIRTFSDAPVLMVTARDDEQTEIRGFRDGADDYITKPVRMFAFTERVQALLRRSGAVRDVVEFGPVRIEQESRTVYVEGAPAVLTPKEYELLVYLAEKKNTACSRQQILNTVWKTDYYGDARTVDTHIKNLRMKLGSAGEYIRTVRSTGYMLEYQP